MKDRILKIMQSEGLTNVEFAEKLGISTSSLSHIFGGRNKPSLDVVLRILMAYPTINPNWLLFEKGEMISGASNVFQMNENREFAASTSSEGENREENPPQEDIVKTKEIIREQIKLVEVPKAKITEIRVYFDNGTYEVFKPSES